MTFDPRKKTNEEGAKDAGKTVKKPFCRKVMYLLTLAKVLPYQDMLWNENYHPGKFLPEKEPSHLRYWRKQGWHVSKYMSRVEF